MPDVVRGKTRKVVQLVGEMDRERGRHPPQTFAKYRLYGTDLGTPLDFGPSRDLWFLFGDAWTATVKLAPPLPPFVEPALYSDKDALKKPYNQYHPFNADPVGVAPRNVTAQNLGETFERSSAKTEDKTTSRSQRLVIQSPSGRCELANPSRSRWQRLSGQSPGSSRRSATQPSWLNSVDQY